MKVNADRFVPRVAAKLSKSNAAMLKTLLELADERDCINFDEALKSLYPGVAPGKAVKKYSKLREAVATAADKAGFPAFRLETDGRTRTPHDSRVTWIETGEQSVTRHLEALVRSEVAVPPGTVPVAGMPVYEERRPVRCGVVSSEEDESLKRRLLTALAPAFRDHPRFRVLPADAGRDLAQCEIGLMLMNHADARSLRKQAGPLMEKVGDSNVVRVAIRPMPSVRREDGEVFVDVNGRAFSQLKTPAAQERFAAELFTKLAACLESLPDSLPEPIDHASLLEAARQAVFARGFDDEKLVRLQGRLTTQDKNVRDEDTESKRDNQFREDALEHLNRWLEDPQGPVYFALLGETGMGKTTLCKVLALELLKRREAGENVPFPLYLDLRNIGEDARRGLLLEEILSLVIDRSWKRGPTGPSLTAAELIDLVEKQDALVIFDGLDEVLVHLSDDSARLFTRQLYRMAPPQLPEDRPRAFRRLLLSCRTHYFRTLSEQKTHFLAEGRDGVEKETYRAFLLLPFNEVQIREYIANTLPDENTDRVMDTLDAVHNLRELAERPFTLSLIVKQFTAIEEDKKAGRIVTGLTLYRNMVRDWMQRDTGKHLFTPDHKWALMEHFAADLWRSGERFWVVQELEKRLVGFVAGNAEFAELYRDKGYELLKEDLRTATFLVREGEDRFRFAHTSLHEFFLAGYLRRALLDGRPELWAMPGVSKETLDFLGQWMLETIGKDRDAAFATLGRIRAGYRAQASELAFAYFLLANKKKYPAPTMAGFQLPGANLRELAVYGAAGTPLVLAGANFRGANLRNMHWRYCNLGDADFRDAQAERTEWLDCHFADSTWAGAALEGTVFRNCSLALSDFENTDTRRPRLQRSDLVETNAHATNAQPTAIRGHQDLVNGCAWSADGSRIVSASYDNTLRVWDAVTGEALLTLTGHEGVVRGCAWSADGSRIVSASDDNTLRVWDAVTGEALLTLTGHQGPVSGCAWSADGSRIVSASDDNTLRVWDAVTGEALLALTGHEGGVRGCAWSADGSRIVSASDDNTLRVWDAVTGEALLTLTGHEGGVMGCAWSADGSRIVSASNANTLRVWDAVTGEALLTLTGHEGVVRGCAWSADGSRIVSASDDKTLRVWDAVTGEALLTLTGHAGWVRGCAWSADGSRIVSASDDNTLRVWDAVTGEALLTLTGHAGGVMGCAWSADGSRIVSASDANTLRVWDAVTGEALLTLTGHAGWVMGCAWSADGSRIVSASNDNTLRVWDAVTGEALLTLTGHAGWVMGCAWSAEGSRIVSASNDNTLRVWDAVTGEALLTLTGHEGTVNGCAWSADGSRIVSASNDNTLRVWDAVTGEALLTLTGHAGWVRGCAWSAEGSRIVSASSDKTLRVWDAVTGEALLTLTGHAGWVRGCAWSADGSRIVSASNDNTLRVWDAVTGEALLTLTGHEDWVTGCAWSADGRRIASASYDGSLLIWDAETGKRTGLAMYHLRNWGGLTWATIDHDKKEIVAMGKEAWRSVGWVVRDETGMPEWLPAEAFGPIPIHD